MNIENVDTDAGTLDIYMTNQAGCSYCENPIYNNNTQNWVDGKEFCEGQGGSTWVAYDPITEEECFAIPSISENGGWWFNGEVGGFQFELSGITITNASSPTGFIMTSGVTTNPYNEGAALLLGFSMTGATIPPPVQEF